MRVASFLIVYSKLRFMKPANRYNREELNRNRESMAYMTLVIFLIITFIASCIYIGIDGFFSR